MLLDDSVWRVQVSSAVRVLCHEDWRLNKEWSERLHDFDLWVVRQGRGWMHLHDCDIDLQPGTCLWMRPGGIYLGNHDPQQPLGVTAIHFDIQDDASQRIDTSQLPGEVHDVKHLPHILPMLDRIVDLLRHCETFGDDDDVAERSTALLRPVLEELVTPLASRQHITPGTSQHHEHIVRSVAQTLEHIEPTGETESLESIAHHHGYSPGHLTRIFKTVFGVTPQVYRVQHRIRLAQQLLKESSLSVSEIADHLGYSDVFFFSRQFKTYTGLSPRHFRDTG